MKQCQNCGMENQDEAKFCRKCGMSLQETTLQKEPEMLQKQENQQFQQYQQYMQQEQPKHQFQPQQQPQKKNKAPMIIALILLVLILVAGGALAVIYMVKNDIISLPFLQTQSRDEKNQEDVEEERSEEKTSEETSDVEEIAATEAMPIEEAVTETAEGEKTFENVITNEPIKLTTQVAASSELKDGKYDYSAQNLLDGDGDTAWVEGVKGTGKGEYVAYQAFDKNEYAFGIAVMPGYLKSADLYYANSEPIELTVTCGDRKEVIDLSDLTNEAYIDMKDKMLFYDFSQPISTADEITVTISSAMLGLKYDDTCITEMYLYTYPLYGNESQYDASAWEITHEGVTSGGHTNGEGYILPESDSTYLTMKDLNGLSEEQCRLARNEIYARHGRMFDDAELQNYFNSCDWYEGTIPAKNFNDQMLNEYEFANRDLIVEYEEKMGYR